MPDQFPHVYAFCTSDSEAAEICRFANGNGATQGGKFIPGRFKVDTVNGSPAVVGTLNQLLRPEGGINSRQAAMESRKMR